MMIIGGWRFVRNTVRSIVPDSIPTNVTERNLTGINRSVLVKKGMHKTQNKELFALVVTAFFAFST